MTDLQPEDENLDVLQNIELTFYYIFLRTPSLTDYEVLSALEALQKNYQSEALGKEPVLPRNPNSLTIYTAAHAICEMRLGRNAAIPIGVDVPGDVKITPITVETLVKNLKHLRKSLDHWNKQGGTRGYLNYISQFLQ